MQRASLQCVAQSERTTLFCITTFMVIFIPMCSRSVELILVFIEVQRIHFAKYFSASEANSRTAS